MLIFISYVHTHEDSSCKMRPNIFTISYACPEKVVCVISSTAPVGGNLLAEGMVSEWTGGVEGT